MGGWGENGLLVFYSRFEVCRGVSVVCVCVCVDICVCV